MSQAMLDIFADWSIPVWLTASVIVAGVIYLRGWQIMRQTRPAQFTRMRLMSFFTALIVLWLAIGSPMDGLADVLLSAHMVEHLLLMSFVPPLLLLGFPVVPLLRGLPEVLRKPVLNPLLRSSILRRIAHFGSLPLVAWLGMNLSFLGWHIPAAYNFALEHEGWHVVEHLCFLSTSILFWWCVLRPWPTPFHPQSWSILLYLVSADVVNTLLSAFLAFCGTPVFSFYLHHPNPFHVLALDDQILGASIMWVVGSIAFLIPAVLITMKLLGSEEKRTLSTIV